MMRTRVRTLTLAGTGSHVTFRRRTSQGRLLIGTPIPGSAASRTPGRSRRRKSICPTTLFVRLKKSCCPGRRRARTPGCPRCAWGRRGAADDSCMLGRVVLEHVAHVRRLVEKHAVRAGRRLDLVDRAAEVVQPRVAVVGLLVGQAEEQREDHESGGEQARLRLVYPPCDEPGHEEQQQRHRDQEVAHLEQLAVEERHEQQEDDRCDGGRAEDHGLPRAAASEQQQREKQEQRPHRGEQLRDVVGVVAPERPRHVRHDRVERQVVVGAARRAERRAGGVELLLGERYERHELDREDGQGVAKAEEQRPRGLAGAAPVDEDAHEDELLHPDQEQAEVVGPEERRGGEDVERPVEDAPVADRPELRQHGEQPEERDEGVHPCLLRVPDEKR